MAAEWTPEARAMEQALVALGDQVQKEIDNSGLPVRGFVLVTDVGNIEYRSRWSMNDFKEVLTIIAEDL